VPLDRQRAACVLFVPAFTDRAEKAVEFIDDDVVSRTGDWAIACVVEYFAAGGLGTDDAGVNPISARASHIHTGEVIGSVHSHVYTILVQVDRLATIDPGIHGRISIVVIELARRNCCALVAGDIPAFPIHGHIEAIRAVIIDEGAIIQA
jgi:hypothetical protein